VSKERSKEKFKLDGGLISARVCLVIERSFVEVINVVCDEIFQSPQNQVASVLGSGLTRLKCFPGSSDEFANVGLGV